MENFKIAAAQIPSVRGDIEANIQTHLQAIEKAVEHNVDYIVFPELSLTGYELDLAKELALSVEDKRLKIFRRMATEGQIIIVIGAPLKNDPLPYLSELIFYPDGQIDTYNKINVHSSEQPYFCSGTDYHIVNVKHHRIANAICADLTVGGHVRECINYDATIYAAGAFISPEGYSRDEKMLSGYSEKYSMPVILANFPQTDERSDSEGKSAIWYEGERIVTADKIQNAIVIAEETVDGWKTNIVEL